jgi:glycine cleavage system regulatory protein
MIKSAAILKNGIILTGHNHSEIIHQYYPTMGKFVGADTQGFINENGKFLNRKEAAKEALKCKQISKLKYSKTELFSEDINYP